MRTRRGWKGMVGLGCLSAFLFPPFCLPLASAKPLPRAMNQTYNRERVQLTIYDNGLAFIRDQRSVLLQSGKNRLTFRGISRSLMTGTLFLRLLPPNAPVKLIEQSFDLDPISYQHMVEHAVGSPITFVAPDLMSGVMTQFRGTLLGIDNGFVVDIQGKVMHFPTAHLVFDNAEHKLVGYPSLNTILEATTPTSAILELSYLTPGISWSNSYTAEVNEADDTVDLLGLTTIQNTTQVDFREANVLLVSTTAASRPSEPAAKSSNDKGSEKPSPSPAQPTFRAADLRGNSYSIPMPINLAPKEGKNIPFIQATKIPGERQFWLVIQTPYDRDSNATIKRVPVTTMISITNAKETGLGVPLPRGELLVYHKVDEASAKVSDQNKLNHIPIEGKIPLRLGDADGINATLQQTDYKKLGPRLIEVGYRILLKNQRTKTVQLRILKELKHVDVHVIRENHSHKRENGLLWMVEIRPNDQQELRYRLRITLPEEE